MKSEQRKQVVDLEQLTAIASGITVRKCIGICFMVWSVQTPLYIYGVVDGWIGLTIGLASSGYVYWHYSDLVDEKVKQWIDNMLVVMTTVQDGEGVLGSTHPIKVSESVMVKSDTQEAEQVFEVKITWDQLIEVIEAGNSQDRLTRDQLSHDVWPNLDRRWRDKEIQSDLKKLGLIGIRNNFRWEWGGPTLGNPPEVEQETDTGEGVGG